MLIKNENPNIYAAPAVKGLIRTYTRCKSHSVLCFGTRFTCDEICHLHSKHGKHNIEHVEAVCWDSVRDSGQH